MAGLGSRLLPTPPRGHTGSQLGVSAHYEAGGEPAPGTQNYDYGPHKIVTGGLTVSYACPRPWCLVLSWACGWTCPRALHSLASTPHTSAKDCQLVHALPATRGCVLSGDKA